MEIKHTDTQTIEYSIKNIFQHIGEDPERAGLKETPSRMTKMWEETFRGYDISKKPKVTTFQNGADGIVYDNMIVDTGSFYSTCEHHFMPFFGTYYFAYIPHPNGLILGLSKVARVVDFYSAKLQIQERLVSDVVNEIKKALGEENPPLGIALVMKGEHLCKTMRGVKKKGEMTTSCLTGWFQDDINTRSEFLQLIK